MFTIPKHFLIERDTAAETNQLIPGCVLSAASLVPNYSSQSLGEAGRALVAQPSSAPAHYALMDSQCSTTPLNIPYGYETTLLNVLRRGGAIYVTHDYKQKTRSWWRLQRPGTNPQTLSEPPNYSESDGMPVVSPNGSVIAWVQPIPNSKDPPVRRVAIEHLERGDTQYIGLEDFWPAGVTLFAVSNDGEVTASTLQGDVLLLDAKGRKETLFRGADYGISVQFTTFKRVGSGWLAWDAYKENGPYAIAWQLAGGSGKYRLPRGRSITSAAADGAGQYVALSATTSYSIGAIKDLLLVLRTRDGAEIFRKYLPTYSRSQVVFLAPHWFAYDDWGNVKVLKLPQ